MLFSFLNDQATLQTFQIFFDNRHITKNAVNCHPVKKNPVIILKTAGITCNVCLNSFAKAKYFRSLRKQPFSLYLRKSKYNTCKGLTLKPN